MCPQLSKLRVQRLTDLFLMLRATSTKKLPLVSQRKSHWRTVAAPALILASPRALRLGESETQGAAPREPPPSTDQVSPDPEGEAPAWDYFMPRRCPSVVVSVPDTRGGGPRSAPRCAATDLTPADKRLSAIGAPGSRAVRELFQ